MRPGILVGLIALVSLVGSVIPSSDAVDKKQTIFVPPKAQIIVLGKLHHADSFVLRNALGHRLYKSESIEYINNAAAILNIPDEIPRSNTDSLHGYQIVTSAYNEPLNARFFANMFQYFSAYDAYFFLSALTLGGLAFLFLFSSLMALIVKIDLLYLFSGFSGIALYTSAIKQYHLPFYTYLSSVDLANLVLYMNIGMLMALLKYLHNLKPNQHPFFVVTLRAWIIGLLVKFAFLFITTSVWVDVFQITLWLALVVYAYSDIYRFTRGIAWSFKLLIILGIPLAVLHWSTLIFDFSSDQSMRIDAAVLVYYIALASFIAEQILSEFNNSIVLNQENLLMEIEVGARQILSVENERKRMVQDLHQDVITRVIDLANQSNSDTFDYTRIETESKVTLQSLRDYSYSLYPPYLEQLSLKNVLQRELDRFSPLESEALIEIIEPETNHFEPVFKLWIYRIFKEYLLVFRRNSNPLKLHFYLNFISNQEWELRISHPMQIAATAEPYPVLSAEIQIYTDYYSAVFEEIDDPHQKGWRFFKDTTIAGKEAQPSYVDR